MKKRSNQKHTLHRIKLGGVRQDQKEQGFFDGRFVTRTTPSKKTYTRKTKHVKSQENEH